MMYELAPAQIEEIDSILPPQFARLRDKYPLTIYNISEVWDLPSHPAGYVPQFIDIYYEDCSGRQPAIKIKDGKLTYVELSDPVTDPTLIYLTIEDDPAYVQIEGRVILNRLGGTVLPDVLTNLEVELRFILNGISAQSS